MGGTFYKSNSEFKELNNPSVHLRHASWQANTCNYFDYVKSQIFRTILLRMEALLRTFSNRACENTFFLLKRLV